VSGLVRKSAGVALCVAGVLAVSYAGVRYASGMYRAEQARQRWEEREAQQQVASARASVGDAGLLNDVVAGAPVARLLIPRVGLDAIVLEGVGDDELNAGPGHLPGSAFPGMPGNAVIAAHRDRHFFRLGELQLGDTIITESGQSMRSWIVTSRRVIRRATPALFETREPTLTLTTCWPIRYFGTAPERLIVAARPIAGSWNAATSTRNERARARS
jgi:sortase A